MPPGFPSHISFGFQLDAADDQLMYHPKMMTGNQAKEHLHFTDLMWKHVETMANNPTKIVRFTTDLQPKKMATSSPTGKMMISTLG